MNSLFSAFIPLSALALSLSLGCGASQPALSDAEISQRRAQWTLAEEPDGALTVLDIREAMLGEARPDVLTLIEDDHDQAGSTAVEGAQAAASHHAAVEPSVTESDHGNHSHEGEAEEKNPSTAVQKEMDVVLVGVVGGVPNPSEQSFAEFPFAKGKALFFLADPEAVADLESHGHVHADGEECVFCAAHAADATKLIAAVQFSDSEGRVLAVDVRELFDVREHETVVVTGLAKAAPGGILTVDANGLYVRR